MGKRKQTLVAQVARNQPRRRRTQAINGSVGADKTTLKYRAIGGTYTTNSEGFTFMARAYCPGFNDGSIAGAAGIAVLAYYSDGKFLPGTSCRWIPNVGFTTSGRVYVGYSTNPEVIASWNSATSASKTTIIQGLGNTVSFPIYQETDVIVPTELRRRMFDTNESIDLTDVNQVDRSVQVFMMAVVVGGPADSGIGNFEYHDHAYVSGLQNVIT